MQRRLLLAAFRTQLPPLQALLRHQVEVGTARVAMAALADNTPTDAENFPPAPPHPLCEMTVPETPSPERPLQEHRTSGAPLEPPNHHNLATRASRHGLPTKTGRAPLAKALHPEHAHVRLLHEAARLFYGVRDSLAGAAPATLKATLLEPVEARVGRELAAALLARTDAEFIDIVAGASVVHILYECFCGQGDAFWVVTGLLLQFQCVWLRLLLAVCVCVVV